MLLLVHFVQLFSACFVLHGKNSDSVPTDTTTKSLKRANYAFPATLKFRKKKVCAIVFLFINAEEVYANIYK